MFARSVIPSSREVNNIGFWTYESDAQRRGNVITIKYLFCLNTLSGFPLL